jgi:2-haloacid dehalogenase
MAAVVFDVMGTLFDLAPLRERLGPGALEAWFERTLHSATSLTLAGTFKPFRDIAEAAFGTTAAKLGLEMEPREATDLLSRLPAVPDARRAFETLEDGGIRIATLTNGGEEHTRGLLEAAGLLDDVEAVITVAEVEAYKPHPEPYRRAVERLGLEPQEITLIAAHGWDVIGAQAAGLQAIWIDRLERRWPLPLPEPRRAETLEEAAAMVVETR